MAEFGGPVFNKLQELDDKINACIQDIANMFGGIENLDKNFAIYDDTTEEFNDILQKLVLLLSEHTGISEYILPHIDEVRKQNNMEHCSPSLHPFIKNEKIDPDVKSKDQSLWNNICLHLENYAFNSVSNNYIPLSPIHNPFNLSQLRNYCISLQSMFIPKDVWEKYKHFRLEYLKRYICKCKPDGCCCACFLKLSIQCIYEDHLLCYIGCFNSHIVTQTNILEIYSDTIQNAFCNLMKLINDSVKARKSVPQEIINMFLSSKDIFQKHSKTCFTCFIDYNLCIDIESIIHCIQNNIDTEELWNKLFIFSISKLAEITSLFEDQINILFNLGKDSNFHSHSDDISALFEGSKLILATDSPEESPHHEYQEFSERGISANKMPFLSNWRLIFVEKGYVTELQRALQNEVETLIKRTTEREKLLLQAGDWRNLVSCDKKINFSSLTIQTNTLLGSVLNTVLMLEKYVPVLKAATGVFQPFKYSFSHTLDTYVIDLLKHIQYLSDHGDNIYVLYIATNNAVFLKHQLKYYCDLMEGPEVHVNENCKNNVCHSVNKLADEVEESLHDLHFKYLSCGVLFDSDSYNFEDTKPFFEGERIAYSIQMWKLYMQGLLHDATYFIPPSFAQELYGKVLSFSLDRFLLRYSQSSASEARHHQIMQDIYAILLCSTELIFPACSYVSEVMGKKVEFNESIIASIMSKIHSNCCCLLSVLVILTAPISELYKVFKDGFPQPRLSIRSKYENVSPWLPWIRRELFSNLGQSKIMSNVSVWLAVRVCTTYNVPLPNALVQAFIEHHCTLSILLMTEAASLHAEENTSSEIIEENKSKLAYSLSVLMLCCDNHSYLLDIFLPVIEKTNGWDEFGLSSMKKLLSKRSWWYKGLYRAIRPFLENTFEDISSFWFEIESKTKDPVALKQWLNFREEMKNHVVCVCPNNLLNSFNENFSFSEDIVAFLCLNKILEKLYDNLMFLPQPFKYALICLNAHLSNYMPEIEPAENSVCIQFLLSSVITYFDEEELVDKLPDSIKKMPVLTSDALYELCRRENIILKSVHYKKKLLKQLALIQEEFDAEKTCYDTSSKSASFDEIKNDILTLTAKKIAEEPKGLNTILYLHQVLRTNESWIQRNLGIPDLLSSDVVVSPISPSPLLRSTFETPRESVSKENLQTSNTAVQKYFDNAAFRPSESFDSEPSLEHTFTVSQDILNLPEANETIFNSGLNLLVDENISLPVYNFNPLCQFDALGASSFAKVAVEKPQLPWESLLSHLPILGITEINFQVLFSRRWDVINEVPLSEEESRQIEDLKHLYKYEE